MKRLTLYAIVLMTLTFCHETQAVDVLATPATNSEILDAKDKQQIEQLINEYAKALKTSNAQLATSLFTKNGIFMPSQGPTAVGAANIKGSFEYVFSMITPNIVFTIDEIIVGGNVAYVTSTSKGTSLVRANGQTVPEINRELFVFEKENGQWKIARYMFNKMTGEK